MSKYIKSLISLTSLTDEAKHELKVNVFFIMLGVIFVILMAVKKLTIPATSIAMSLQSLSISLLVIFLEKNAIWVIVLYLLMASLGLPVLAGAASNSMWYFQPYAGYYIGFLMSSIILLRSLALVRPTNYLNIWLCFALNESTILLTGFIILSLHIGVMNAWIIGVYPYIFGACLKISMAAYVYFNTRI